MAQAENYAFVMNVASLPVESYELAPGHTLRRATHEEAEEIKQNLEHLSVTRGATLIGTLLWEARFPLTRTSLQSGPESEWRYYVLSFTGPNAIVNELEIAANIAPLELELGFAAIGTVPGAGRHGLVLNPGRMFHVLENARMDATFFVSPTVEELTEITRVYSEFRQEHPELDEIKRLARRVTDLKGFPHRSPLRFLGYVAILEALLTHLPKPSDPYDSITRQIKKKLLLLNNRFPRRIEYAPFGNVSPEKLWSRIYEYRSQLAHGGNPDFSGDLAILGNHEQALRLVKETVKAVVRQALMEPRLLLDLREC
jgi:hypothetical protein